MSPYISKQKTSQTLQLHSWGHIYYAQQDYLFAHKYSKNSNIMKYYYNLK